GEASCPMGPAIPGDESPGVLRSIPQKRSQRLVGAGYQLVPSQHTAAGDPPAFRVCRRRNAWVKGTHGFPELGLAYGDAGAATRARSSATSRSATGKASSGLAASASAPRIKWP